MHLDVDTLVMQTHCFACAVLCALALAFLSDAFTLNMSGIYMTQYRSPTLPSCGTDLRGGVSVTFSPSMIDTCYTCYHCVALAMNEWQICMFWE